ncbi:MarC family protein [Planctomycetota bacterium]
MDTLHQIFVNFLYILALLNPLSKVAVLSASSADELQDLRSVVLKSTFVATGILLGVMFLGDIILRDIFRVELYALRIAGGAVLLTTGFNALRKGVFFEKDTQARFTDLAIVPLACPMIAGPATIAASLALAAPLGLWMPLCAVVLALGVNALIMLFSQTIGSILTHFNILGAVIRITGLIVMTMGVQMILDGTSQWLATLKLAA